MGVLRCRYRNFLLHLCSAFHFDIAFQSTLCRNWCYISNFYFLTAHFPKNHFQTHHFLANNTIFTHTFGNNRALLVE